MYLFVTRGMVKLLLNGEEGVYDVQEVSITLEAYNSS